MSEQALLFAAADLEGLGKLHWRGVGSATGRTFFLFRGDEELPVWVKHCGHPTALRPWYGNQIADTAWPHLQDALAETMEAAL